MLMDNIPHTTTEFQSNKNSTTSALKYYINTAKVYTIHICHKSPQSLIFHYPGNTGFFGDIPSRYSPPGMPLNKTSPLEEIGSGRE